jgi:hypothetical protein
MSGISSFDSKILAYGELGLRGPRNPCKHRKCIKKKMEAINVLLEDTMKLNEVMELENSTLIGKFLSR